MYRFVFRTLPDPFMEALDCPDASQLTPARNVSVTALQALAMLNDKFMVRMSEHLAARAAKAAPICRRRCGPFTFGAGSRTDPRKRQRC